MYHYALLQKHKNDSGVMWENHRTGTHGVPFFLEGERGPVLVAPTDAEIPLPTTSRRLRFEPSPESTIYWNESDGRPPEVQAFVDHCDDLSVYRVDPLRTQTLHKKVKDFTAGKETNEWAFRTERILPGEDVYVLGHAHPPGQRDLPDDVSAVIEDRGGSSGL